MPPRSPRADTLRPDEVLELAKELSSREPVSEVIIRRVVSALYFSLFNYWAARRYDRGVRGRGPRQNRFAYRELHEDMLKEGLDAEVVFLYTYRTASDHYVLNPTIIEVFNKALEKILGKRARARIDKTSLERAIESAEEIVKCIRKNARSSRVDSAGSKP